MQSRGGCSTRRRDPAYQPPSSLSDIDDFGRGSQPLDRPLPAWLPVPLSRCAWRQVAEQDAGSPPIRLAHGRTRYWIMARTEVLDDPSMVEVQAVAEALDTDLHAGLTSAEASRRLAEDGPNELRAAPPVPTWRKILAQFQDPLIYLLLGAVVISLFVWLIEGRVGWPVDALVIAAVVVSNAVLGYVQQAKAESAVAALQQMTAVTSAVIRDGQLVRVPSDKLVRGDLLVLGEGDAVGADARLTQAAALKIQESSLTGESEAVQKDVITLSAPVALGDQHGMVFKGTAVVQGTGQAVVTATGMDTEMGAIAEMLERLRRTPPHCRTR
jgi:P-type Ca2+ transporter type 2C